MGDDPSHLWVSLPSGIVAERAGARAAAVQVRSSSGEPSENRCPRVAAVLARSGGVVFERDAIKPGERVPDVRFVVDRQGAVTLRVHVCERTVREPRPLFLGQLRHARPNLPAPPAIPGMDLAGNARETATLLPGEDIEEGALRR